MLRRVMVLLTCLVLLGNVALGQSAAEWRRFKDDCRRRGGTICDIYNDCDGRCTMPGNSGVSNNDYTPPPPPPNPLPRLTNEYRSVRGWFNPNAFPDAPAWVEPSSLSELYSALNQLSGFAGNKLWSLRQRKTNLEREYQELEERIRQNTDLSVSLRSQIASLESEIARNTQETQETEAALSSQQARQDQLSSVITQIEVEGRTIRASIFEQLHDAAGRGWLQPPSSYHPLPRPLDPEYTGTNQYYAVAPYAPAFAVVPLMPLSPASAAAARASRPPLPRSTPVTEREVQQRIDEINNMRPELVSAINSLNEVASRVANLRRFDTTTSDTVKSLSGQRDIRASARDLAIGTLNTAKAKLGDAIAEYQRRSDQLPFQCLELAFWRAYSERVRDSIKTAFPDVNAALPAIDTKSLGRLVKVMRHVIQLQSETFAVAGRIPNAMIGEDENPLQLKKELDSVVTRFKVNLVNDLTGFKLIKFVPEEDDS